MGRHFKYTYVHNLCIAFLFIVFALFSSAIVTTVRSDETFAAACTKAQLDANKSTYTTNSKSGNINEARSGVFTEDGGVRSEPSCEPYAAGFTVTYKKDANNPKLYIASNEPCGDQILLNSTPSTSAASVSGTWQERTGQGTRGSSCANGSSSKTIAVTVTDGGENNDGGNNSGCTEQYYLPLNAASLKGQVCEDGSLKAYEFAKSSDNSLVFTRLTGPDGVRGKGCGSGYNARITLKSEPTNSRPVKATLQTLYNSGSGICKDQGAARTIDVSATAMDTSVLGDYAGVGTKYVEATCASALQLGKEDYEDCVALRIGDFKKFIDECSADGAEASAVIDCLITKAPIIAGDLEALKEQVESPPTCQIDAIGWIICPVMNFMAGIVDAAYGFVASLLNVQPLTFNEPDGGIYGAWAIMRNIANIAFIIAFLIIIFSQLTSVGISNYGVKKMLPRLVIAAILVNASYIICALAVDLSNITGNSMIQLFQSVSAAIPTEKEPSLPGFSADFESGTGWTGLVGGVVAGTAIIGVTMYVGLSALIPALLAALLAIVTVFLVLTLRQALIILLIVISPLAFVAYLLPNTEKLFDSWRKLLLTLLLMYPIISGIFGASALASTVVMDAAEGPYKIVIQIMGALIAILPLAITPVVMKTAGGVLNRFGGIVNNPNKGPFDKLRKRAEGYREDRQNIRAGRAANGGPVFGGGQFRRAAKRTARTNNLKNERSRAEQQYIANKMTNAQGDPSFFAQRMAGGGLAFDADPAALQRALAGAKFTIEKAEADDVKAEHAVIDSLQTHDTKDSNGRNVEGLNSIIANKDGKHSEARVSAAIERLAKVGSTEEIAAVANQYGSSGSSSLINRSLASALASDGPEFMKASDLDNIANGRMGATYDKNNPNDPAKNRSGAKFETIAVENIRSGVLSQEKMVGASNDTLRYARDLTSGTGETEPQRAYNAGFADAEARKVLKNTATKLLDNEDLQGKIKHNVGGITELTR